MILIENTLMKFIVMRTSNNGRFNMYEIIMFLVK